MSGYITILSKQNSKKLLNNNPDKTNHEEKLTQELLYDQTTNE